MMGQSLRQKARNASILPGFAPVSIPRPVDPWGVLPELFEAIVFARLGREQVDDDVAVVVHDALARLVSLDGQALVADPARGRVDLLGEGVDLPAGRTGDEDGEVVDRRLAAHVEVVNVAGV